MQRVSGEVGRGDDDRIRSLQRQLDDALRQLDKMEARLDSKESRSRKLSKPMQKVYENGGVIRQCRRDGSVKKTLLMADEPKERISINSRLGRAIQHVARNI